MNTVSGLRAVRSGIVAGLLLLLVAGAASSREGGDPAAAGRFLDIVEVARDAAGGWIVRGTARYPDGIVLLATLHFAGSQGPFARGSVAQGRFEIPFEPPKGRLIAGTYSVRVEAAERDQSWDVIRQMPEKFEPDADAFDLVVGQPEEGERDRAVVREKIGTALNGMRRLFRQLTERGSFVLSAMNAARKQGNGVIPDAARKKILEEWDYYGSNYWEDALRTIEMDYQEYRTRVFLSPFPEADADVQQTFVFLRRMYGAYWGEIAKYLGEKVPARVEGSPFTRAQLQGQLRTVAERAYEKAGIEKLEWDLIDLAQEEKGETQGNTYVSKTAKFRIDRPEGWTFETSSTSPTTRLRLIPPDMPADAAAGPDAKYSVVVVVEVKDYPEAENFKDLAAMTEMFNFERWPGFKKLTSHDLSVADATMPGGVRPGYRILLKTEDKKRIFRIDDYELFCRWHKRTYGVLCIATPEVHKKFEKDFEAIQRSFAILDAPEPDDKK